ncbi:MAG: hypothetical protein Q4A78_12385 [Peptostreptococcaceae bacterium]|nr:hypothetical protein [Peptostreptococcaceae bacterium]
MKIDWKRKLSSRKFQAAVVGMLLPVFALSKMDEMTQKQIIALVTAVLSLVAYMFAEAYVDGKREEGIILIEDSENEG